MMMMKMMLMLMPHRLMCRRDCARRPWRMCVCVVVLVRAVDETSRLGVRSWRASQINLVTRVQCTSITTRRAVTCKKCF